RFRPITMTTMAAMLGGLPLAIGIGTGSELRRPLGIAIVGGLLFSQLLTLYTTPVVYLYLDRFRLWWGRRRQPRRAPVPGGSEAEDEGNAMKAPFSLLLSSGLLAAGTAVGPNYHKPTVETPGAFKEAPPAGWKTAQPQDAALRGKWWEMFGDPQLN